ncbi:hypothetical protein HDU93_004757 [Gonapodya sp. JEL0774]|nr:hypothetical protein HDU93_004757 [Gonapodya sp. JEL0774]
MFGIRHFVALGMVASAFLPPYWALLPAAALTLPSFLSWCGRSLGLIEEPTLKEIRRGRHTARIEGDFVVFQIGAKWNGPSPLNSTFKTIGDAFVGMVKELEAAPDSWGYLGSETCLGTDMNGPSLVTIMYWRSFEQLTNFARGTNSLHFPAWKFLMEQGRKNPSVGFWHETYIVAHAQYENVYINMAPMGLSNCLHTTTVPATGHLASAKGRAGITKGEDYVVENGKPDY